MSEIKGQLLTIILVLVVFGGISVAIAGIFKSTAKQVENKSMNLGADATEVFSDVSMPSSLLSYRD